MSRDHIIKRSRELVGEFGGHRYCVSVDISYFLHLSHDHVIKRSRDGEWGLPTISYHSAKFCGNRYSGSADISFFNLSRDYIIKRPPDFEVVVPSP